MHARKLAAACAAAAAAVAVAAVPVQAATDTTAITLTGGALDFATPFTAADFPSTQLTGSAQTIKATVNNWSVNDARGSLLGWNVKIQASRFETSDGKQLPAGALSLTAPTVAAGSGQASTLKPVVQTLTPLDAGAAVPVAVAALSTGQGLWNFGQGADNLTLVIPPTVEAGTYTSTITTTLSSGVL
jgi:hypothetical protein